MLSSRTNAPDAGRDRAGAVVPSSGRSALAVPAPAAWRVGLTALVDLLLPPFCAVCDAVLQDGRRDPLCGACWRNVERVTPPLCAVCGLPLGRYRTSPPPAVDRSPTARCGPCRARPPAFAYARSAATYDEVVREALHAFKFRGQRALAAPLGDLIAETGLETLPVAAPDLLIPVPLFPGRERTRGFNQAALLARRVGRSWGLPVHRDVLVRAIDTRAQTELTGRERRQNVRGAFRVRRPDTVAGRHVIVVDDILTTGSTAGACALALYRAGAATVGVLTVARAG
jgi:ComF family protein